MGNRRETHALRGDWRLSKEKCVKDADSKTIESLLNSAYYQNQNTVTELHLLHADNINTLCVYEHYIEHAHRRDNNPTHREELNKCRKAQQLSYPPPRRRT
ncbi:hypothetical protein PV326_003449, partial [Microctonus aethiopoides]